MSDLVTTIMRGTVRGSHDISESLMGDMYMSEDEAREFIIARDGDSIAKHDIVDEDTGEVYIEEGQPYNTSPWNPDHRVNKRRAEKDKQYGVRAGVPQYCDGCDRLEKDCVCGQEPEEEWMTREEAQEAYFKAVREFAAGGEDFMADNPGLEPNESYALDMAENFFYMYPDWMKWAEALGEKKSWMKSYIADMIWERMVSHSVKDEARSLIGTLVRESVRSSLRRR